MSIKTATLNGVLTIEIARPEKKNALTAAMYHVSTDNAVPYRVCSGQQDSGSACVNSSSMDGRITFHDWHSVSIQEYGIAASDPKDPDLVFGSGRNNVTLYNRKTGQTTLVGPSREQLGAHQPRSCTTDVEDTHLRGQVCGQGQAKPARQHHRTFGFSA